MKEIRQLTLRGADRVIILVDREDRPECPGDLAKQITTALVPSTGDHVYVVVKDRAFENWVIADLDALRAQPKRFEVSRSVERQVNDRGAGAVDALRLLK